MQYTLLTAALGLASLSSASAISNNVRSSSLLKLPVTAVQQSSALSKRQNDVNVINSFQGTTYLVDVLVGTPSQKTTLGLDTGSSSTWVNPECATAGSSGSVSFCESISQFNWQASTTLKNEGLPMTLAYGVGEANGTFVTDVLTVGNAKITNQEIGICGKSVDMATGLIAVGPYDGLTVGGTGNPTLIDNLASEGFTNSRAFSLDLRDVDSPDGSIIFGGIDTGKYEGALEKLPIIPPALAHDHLARYWVNMNSIGITKPGQAAKKYPSTNQPVVLDSGSTISILPDALVDEIVADFGATYDAIADLYKVDCSYTSQDGTMDFTFGTKEIKVPYKQFIWAQQGQPCYLGVHKNSNFIILGDSFLRAAYVVFDQDNQNIHIAQAANCGTNLVEIGKGANAVPSLVGDCGKTSTTTTSKTSSQTSSKTSSKTSSETLSETTSTSSPATTTSAPATTTAPASTYPASTYQASSQASYPVGNSTASGSISIVYSTTVYTISSCAATVTNCPYGQTTTEVISAYTTYCPETGTSPVTTATGSVYPIQPSYTPLPTFTGSAGKAAASIVAVLMAAVAVVAML